MKRQDCYVNIKQIHVTILPCSFWNMEPWNYLEVLGMGETQAGQVWITF